MFDFSEDQYLEYFVYLDELQESGVTNMFGAGEYLEAQFGMDRKEARIVLQLWIATAGYESQPAWGVRFTKVN